MMVYVKSDRDTKDLRVLGCMIRRVVLLTWLIWLWKLLIIKAGKVMFSFLMEKVLKKLLIKRKSSSGMCN